MISSLCLASDKGTNLNEPSAVVKKIVLDTKLH